jgi:hypothetical protein
MRIFRKATPASPPEAAPASPPGNDLVAYARAHLTSPAALALLDEVERGRRRREQGMHIRHRRHQDQP